VYAILGYHVLRRGTEQLESEDIIQFVFRILRITSVSAFKHSHTEREDFRQKGYWDTSSEEFVRAFLEANGQVGASHDSARGTHCVIVRILVIATKRNPSISQIEGTPDEHTRSLLTLAVIFLLWTQGMIVVVELCRLAE
jgi:hypothetical protein